MAKRQILPLESLIRFVCSAKPCLNQIAATTTRVLHWGHMHAPGRLKANCGSILHDSVHLLGTAQLGHRPIEKLTKVTLMAQPT